VFAMKYFDGRSGQRTISEDAKGVKDAQFVLSFVKIRINECDGLASGWGKTLGLRFGGAP
jgi:hypothetical protein